MTELQRALDEHGWVVVDSPGGASSTVGLTARGLPELVVLGLPAEVGGSLLRAVAERLLGGDDVPDLAPLDGLLDGPSPVLLTVGRELPSPAAEVYGSATRLRQLVWPDADGLLPWQPGFAHSDLQPLLAEPPTEAPVPDDAELWPLAEDPHLQVLSSRAVAREDAPVLVVVRTHEGELHFLDGVSDFNPARAVAECLHEALERDRSLVGAVRDLASGMAAERDDVDRPWELGTW